VGLKLMDEINSEWVSNFLKEKGFKNTSRWIVFALKTRMPDIQKDFNDVIFSMQMEVRDYRRGAYNYPNAKEACFNSILNLIIGGMTVGSSKFNILTKALAPIAQGSVETIRILNDIVGVAEKLEDKPKFLMICFYYLLLWEGSYKNICKQLLAMKRLKEGKNVRITETRKVLSEEKTEEKKNLESVLPNHLKNGHHRNLRNAIAHAHFRYLPEKNEMLFWDVRPNGQYSFRPKSFSYQEFSKYLLDVNVFCEVFAFVVLLLVAIQDIAKRRHA